jgi:hypothetical protein
MCVTNWKYNKVSIIREEGIATEAMDVTRIDG